MRSIWSSSRRARCWPRRREVTAATPVRGVAPFPDLKVPFFGVTDAERSSYRGPHAPSRQLRSASRPLMASFAATLRIRLSGRRLHYSRNRRRRVRLQFELPADASAEEVAYIESSVPRIETGLLELQTPAPARWYSVASPRSLKTATCSAVRLRCRAIKSHPAAKAFSIRKIRSRLWRRQALPASTAS